MYRTSAQITSAIQILSLWFPNFFAQRQLPENSIQSQPIYALRVRAGGGGSRRAVLIVGGTHARELMNPDAIVELAIDLFLSYANGSDIVYGNRTWAADDIKLMLESLDIWMIPCSNPDGRDDVIGGDSLWRKNRRVNAGTTCLGIDLNRNSNILWGVAQGQTSCSPCSEVYCGPGAFSEPETRNVKSLLDSEPVVSFVDVHSYSELVLYPWGHAPTQSTDPSKVFTTLPTGTCTASVPSGYGEYMPAIDVQRFTTVAQRVVDDIRAVRGRQYTPETGLALYPTTGTQSDYAYSRHIADSSLYKTYGFTFETGPPAATADESFHPNDPTLIKQDAKAGMISLLQQSVCAIELIGLDLFGSGGLRSFRRVRDEVLASTLAGREWVALFERLQFPLLARVMASPKMTRQAKDLLAAAGRLLEEPRKEIDPQLAKRAQAFVGELLARTKSAAHRRDLAKVLIEVKRLAGRSIETVVAGLMRRSATKTRVRTGKKRVVRKSTQRRKRGR
jgi:murein tripeptide amidase MpaA